MNLVAERRVGIGIEISEFVVKEEKSIFDTLSKIADAARVFIVNFFQKEANAGANIDNSIFNNLNSDVKEIKIAIFFQKHILYLINKINYYFNLFKKNSYINFFIFICKKIFLFCKFTIKIFVYILKKYKLIKDKTHLISCLVMYHWDRYISLPEFPIDIKKWWQKPLFYMPITLIFCGFLLYVFSPIGKTQALAVPPIEIRADLTDAEWAETSVPEMLLLNGEAKASVVLRNREFDMPPAPEAPWVPVNRAFPSYNLQSPDTEGMQFEYRVHARNRYARREMMNWVQTKKQGEKSDADQVTLGFIHLAVERFEQKKPAPVPFNADMISRAEEHGLSIDKMAASTRTLTKFGLVEIAESVFINGQTQNACLIYRYKDPIGFVIAGWYCGTAKRPVDRVTFACFIDKLDIIQAGQDLPLRAFFAAAERQRMYTNLQCGLSRQAGRRTTWLDHESPFPSLKLSPSRQHSSLRRTKQP